MSWPHYYRNVDRLLIWSLPLWTAARVMLGFTPPSFVAICAPLGVLVAHWIATWRRPDYWQLTAPRLGLCLSAAGWGVCGAVFGAISVAIDAAFRLPSLKPVPGPWCVGVVDYEVRCNKRGEERRIIGRMLYPTSAHQDCAGYIAMQDRHKLTRAFIQNAAPRELRPYLPRWILGHWAAIGIRAKYGATPALPSAADTPSGDGKLPVIVFSHGLTATRETSSSMALSLAAAGALVLLVEHTDRSSSLARFVEADPSTGAPSALPYDASVMDLGYEPATEAYKEARRAQTLIRATNVEDTLEFLEAIEEGSVQSGGTRGMHVRMDGLADAQVETLLSTLRGRLAIDRLVLGGHSFGGATALTVCADRVAAQHGAGAVAAQHGADVAGAQHGGARDERSSDRIRPAQIGACFALDPAVDWMPRRVWTATGYDGVFNDTRYASEAEGLRACGGRAPPLTQHLPLLTIWSEQWVEFHWYQIWARRVLVGAARPACTLTIAGAGHQGLCDLAYTMPHWLNLVLKTSLGTTSAEMDRATTASVLGFLRGAKLLMPEGASLDGAAGLDLVLDKVAYTARHVHATP